MKIILKGKPISTQHAYWQSGKIRFMISGGAALSVEVANFFYAAGLLILEGYGLSETSPVLTVNRPNLYRFGSVGKPLENVEIKLAKDGEICVKGEKEVDFAIYKSGP